MIEPRIVQRLRDAAEEHRVHPEVPVRLTVRLDDGSSVSGTPVAVEDGAVWLRTGQGEDASPLDLSAVTGLEQDTVVDVRGLDLRGLDLRRAELQPAEQC